MSQFPVRKIRRARTVVNQAADGSTIKLADPLGAVTEWDLTYTDLSDAEASALLTFYVAVEGTLTGFTFLDPAGNLLAASDDLNQAAWQKDPLLSLTGSVNDPLGGTLAWRLTNGGAAEQALGQTLEAPGAYLYCLSAYVRAATASSVGLTIGSQGDATGGDQRVDADRLDFQRRPTRDVGTIRDSDWRGRHGGSVRTPGGGAGCGVGI